MHWKYMYMEEKYLITYMIKTNDIKRDYVCTGMLEDQPRSQPPFPLLMLTPRETKETEPGNEAFGISLFEICFLFNNFTC